MSAADMAVTVAVVTALAAVAVNVWVYVLKAKAQRGEELLPHCEQYPLPETPFYGGKPPHVGWWLTIFTYEGVSGTVLHYRVWRWWDGEYWSAGALETFDDAQALRVANCRRAESNVRWSHYWPQNARVPRINPDTLEETS